MTVDLPPEGAAPDAPPAAAPKWFPRPLWTAKLALQRFILVATGALVTILIFVQVVTRYFLGVSIFGIEEAASFLAIWLYFIGGAYGAYERGHIFGQPGRPHRFRGPGAAGAQAPDLGPDRDPVGLDDALGDPLSSRHAPARHHVARARDPDGLGARRDPARADSHDVLFAVELLEDVSRLRSEAPR